MNPGHGNTGNSNGVFPGVPNQGPNAPGNAGGSCPPPHFGQVPMYPGPYGFSPYGPHYPMVPPGARGNPGHPPVPTMANITQAPFPSHTSPFHLASSGGAGGHGMQFNGPSMYNPPHMPSHGMLMGGNVGGHRGLVLPGVVARVPHAEPPGNHNGRAGRKGGRGKGKNGGGNTGNGNRKQTIVKSCDTCDKHFTNETQYTDHMSKHSECVWEGCTFVASRAKLNAHMAEVHNYAMSDAPKGWVPKIVHETPEEIAAYREARRKRFPTKDNIKKKTVEEAEREARGELPRPNPKGKRQSSQKTNSRATKRAKTESTPTTTTPTTTTTTPTPTPTTAAAAGGGGGGGGGGEGPPSASTAPGGAKVGLAALAAMYTSDSEDDDDASTNNSSSDDIAPDELPVHDSNANSLPLSPEAGKGDGSTKKRRKPQRVCSFFRRSKCKNGDRCRFSHNPVLVERMNQSMAERQERIRKEKEAKRRKERVPAGHGFLKRLLAKDIAEKQSIVLQCFRDMVNNNFYQTAPPT